MSLGEYLIGLGFFGTMLGGSCGCAIIVVRRRLSHLPLVARLTAGGLIATTAVIFTHLMPGVLGILTREAVAVVSALTLLSARFLIKRAAGAEREAGPPIERTRAYQIGAAAGWLTVGLVVAYALAVLAANAGTPVFAHDQLAFKLPNVERWIERQSLWGYDLFLPMKNTGSYPQNGDLAILAVVLPWDNDAFVRATQYPFAGLLGFAIYAACRELGSTRGGSLLACGLLIAMPVVTVTAFRSALPDTMMLFTFAAGTLFLLRHHRTGMRADLALAGLGFGLALGTKWYGLSGVILLVGVWLVARLTPRGVAAGRVLRETAVLSAIILAAGGFWFLRNWIETGNPFYPVRLEVAGMTILDAPLDLEQPIYGLSIAHYLGDAGAWTDHLLPAFWGQFGLIGLILLVGALAGGIAAWKLRWAQEGLVVVALLVVSTLLVAAYMVTPYSGHGFDGEPNFAFVNTRWVVPALMLWAIAAGWATRSLRSPAAWIVLGAICVVATLWALRRGLSPPTSTVALVITMLGALGLAVGTRNSGALLGTGARRIAPGLAVIAAVAVAGYVAQQDFNDDRYLGSDPTFDVVLNSDEDLKVGITGNWNDAGPPPTWAMFGQKLDNEVEYVGEIVNGHLAPYGTEAEWLSAVRRGGYDFVLAGEEPHIVGDSLERIWAADSLDAVAASDRFTLYEMPSSPQD